MMTKLDKKEAEMENKLDRKDVEMEMIQTKMSALEKKVDNMDLSAAVTEAVRDLPYEMVSKALPWKQGSHLHVHQWREDDRIPVP